MAEVYINNKFVGTIDDAPLFIEDFKDQRRKGIIAEEANIYYEEEFSEIYINTSGGRALRPLIIVKEGKPLLTEKQIEQLDAGEISCI